MPTENRIWGDVSELVVVPSYACICVAVISKKISLIIFYLETFLAVVVLFDSAAQSEAYVLVRFEFNIIGDLYNNIAFR